MMTRMQWIGGLGLVLAILAVGCEKKESATTGGGAGGEKQATPSPAAPAPRATEDATRPAGEPRETATGPAQAKAPAGPPKVEMRIRQGNDDWGWIVIELDEEKAPVTVKNFLQYVDKGYFNGTIFHRVKPDFMIQGGGYTAPGQKKPGQHDPIPLEARNGLKNTRGTIAMARTDNPDSATSEFFINVVDNAFLNPSPRGPGYTVFGHVVEGMDVVDRIKNVPTRPEGEGTTPVDPPVIVTAQRSK